MRGSRHKSGTYSQAEVARLTGYNPNSLGYAIRTRLVPSVEVNGKWRVLEVGIPLLREMAKTEGRKRTQVVALYQGGMFEKLKEPLPSLEKEEYSHEKAGRILGLSRKAIRNRVDSGELPKRRSKNGHFMLTASDICRLRQKLKKEFRQFL